MIIKNLTRKKTGTGQLVRYIFKYILKNEKQLAILQKSKEHPLIIRQNIRSRTINGYIREFEQNRLNRIHRRSDQTIINHTILSWSHKDASHITDKMLRQIAREYIRLRGENNLYVGTKHMDRQHIHLHLAMSGSQLNGRSSRISKEAFAKLKIEMDRYQLKHYPELVNSLPLHGRAKELNTPVSAIEEIERRKGRASLKETLSKVLEEAYTKSKSVEEFLAELRSQGHDPYYRAGQLTGVKFGDRKYRLARLGFDSKKIDGLDSLRIKEDNLLTELQNLRGSSKEFEKDRKDDELERNFENDNNSDEGKEDSMNEMPMSFPLKFQGYGDFPTRGISQKTRVSPG